MQDEGPAIRSRILAEFCRAITNANSFVRQLV